MLDKLQENIKRGRDERSRRKLEKELEQLEREAAEAQRRSEQLQAEQQRVQAEKERLLALDDKALMVELIFAARGLHSRLESVEAQQAYLSQAIDDIRDDIDSVRADIAQLELG